MNIAGYNIRPFVVVLQEMPEKEQFIQNHFREVGIQAEPFNGIHGTTSGLRTVWPYERDAPGSGWNIGCKPVATWLSFYMMWSALQYMPEQYFWTLEWDCRFPSDWRPRVEAALRAVPHDFDVLMVGSCCCEGQPKKHVAGEVYEIATAQCGHSTILSKRAVTTLLKTQRKVYSPLDISLVLHTFPLLKVYAILPRVCDQFSTDLKP